MSCPVGYTMFETAIGPCGIAWTTRGIAGFQLPEASAAETRARLLRQRPAAVEATPPPAIAATIAAVTALLAGAPADLSDAPLDLDGVPDFHRRVYAEARKIPPGRTATYGEIAARLGEPGAAQAVGQALGKNPIAVIVPCHRVLAKGGGTGGFSAAGGVALKLRLLAIEGARTSAEPTLFDADPAFRPAARR